MLQTRLRGHALTKARKQVRREQPLCLHCKAEGKLRAWDELDHIKPLEHGGGNDRRNLQGLCRAHHLAKTAKDRGYSTQGCRVDGTPLDSSHHWHGAG